MDSGNDPEAGVGGDAHGTVPAGHDLGSPQGFLGARLPLWAAPPPLSKGRGWGPFSPRSRWIPGRASLRACSAGGGGFPRRPEPGLGPRADGGWRDAIRRHAALRDVVPGAAPEAQQHAKNRQPGVKSLPQGKRGSLLPSRKAKLFYYDCTMIST